VSNNYATLAELRADLGGTVVGDATTLQRLLDAAAADIDRFCNRPDGFVAMSTAAARLYTGSGEAVQWIDECAAVTLVEVKDAVTDTDYVAWTTDDWDAASGSPESPNFNRTPYRFLLTTAGGDYAVFTAGRYAGRRGFRPEPDSRRAVPTVRVTAKWGYALTVPTDIKVATIMQATRWFKRMRSGMADAVGMAETGILMYTKALDPDIQHILVGGRYVRPTVG
jgi:hypothetical protein